METSVRVALPKSMNASKAGRRLDISVDSDGTSWIPIEEMFRVLDLKPDRLLDESQEYFLITELVNLEHKWDTLQQFYAAVPEAFEGSDDFTIRIARHMLKKNRRPVQALAMMDPDMVKLVLKLETIRQNPAKIKIAKLPCTFCSAPDAKLRCSACKEIGCVEILYCSKECQTADWKSHKKRCCKTIVPKNESRLGELQWPEKSEAKVDVLETLMRLCSKMQSSD